MPDTFHTLGILAMKLGCQAHHLDRLCRRGKIPFTAAGRLRLLAEKDIPAVRAALVKAGFLKPDRAEVSNA